MPSTSRSQQRLFCMALAVRKGELKRTEVDKKVLKIVDSDMTDKQIADFTVLKESFSSLKDYIRENINYADLKITEKLPEVDRGVFIIVKPGFLKLSSQIIDMFHKAGFKLLRSRTTLLTPSQAQRIYRVHRKEKWYRDLWKYMSSDLSLGLIFSYECSEKEAFRRCSELKEKIREKWSEDDKRNVMHSSDNSRDMMYESSFYF